MKVGERNVEREKVVNYFLALCMAAEHSGESISPVDAGNIALIAKQCIDDLNNVIAVVEGELGYELEYE